MFGILAIINLFSAYNWNNWIIYEYEKKYKRKVPLKIMFEYTKLDMQEIIISHVHNLCDIITYIIYFNH